MKAFKIGWSDTKRSMAVDLGYRLNVPRVECHDCCRQSRAWGEPFFEFPALRLRFLSESGCRYDRIVSVEEFRLLKQRVSQAVGRTVNLIPGCSVGELAGDAFTKELDDIVWGRILYPQISKRARDLLAGEGIFLTTTQCSIRLRRKSIDSHVAVQIEPVAMLAERCRQNLGITHCPRCGRFKQRPPGGTIGRPGIGPRKSRRYLLRRDAWPAGQHLVCVQETLDVLASPEFIEAVKKHKLKDIAFLECGYFV